MLPLSGTLREVIGATLRPAGLRIVLPRGAGLLAAPLFALQDIWGQSARDLMDVLMAQRSPVARLSVLERYLRGRLAHVRSPHPVASHSIELIQLADGDATVDDVAEACGCTTRTLYNATVAECGLTPKQVARIVRMRRTIQLLTRSRRSLGDAAAEAAFADQAHMSREFRSLLFSSPKNVVDRLRSHKALSPIVATTHSLVNTGLLLHT
jgi:AraC-like DNA-binding protein